MTRRPRHRRNLGDAIGDRSRHNDERALREAPRGETYLNDRCAFGARWHNPGDSLSRAPEVRARSAAQAFSIHNENDCCLHARKEHSGETHPDARSTQRGGLWTELARFRVEG